MISNINREELEKLNEYLENYDLSLKTKRLHRFYLLSKIYPNEIEILGRAETIILLKEIKETFINGQHLSTIILSQTFLEKALYNHLKNSDKNFENTSFYGMIIFARTNGLLPNKLLDMLNEIRLKRNPLVHQNKNSFNTTLAKRKLETEHSEYNDLLEEDAVGCLIILYTFLKHKVFNYDFGIDFIESQ